MNIAELLDELGIPIRRHGEHHHARDGWVQADCPWCSPNSGAYRLGFNIRGSYCNCWVCGPQELWNTVALLANKALGQLRDRLQELDKSPFQKQEHRGKLVLPNRLGPLTKVHKEYLRHRGFNPKQIVKLWQVQGIDHLGGQLAWRIFIPVVQQGRTVSWTTRTIDAKATTKRYIAAKSEDSLLPRSQVLYGEDYARWAVIVTEGPTDAWALGPGAVATLGTGFSQDQLYLLKKYPIRAVCFDNDYEAQKRARKLVEALSQFPGQTANVVLDAKDPASAPKRDIKKLRAMFFGD